MVNENNVNSATRAKSKYNEKAYDRITVSFPKGTKLLLEQVAQEFENKGLIKKSLSNKPSLNGAIVKIVSDYLKSLS